MLHFLENKNGSQLLQDLIQYYVALVQCNVFDWFEFWLQQAVGSSCSQSIGQWPYLCCCRRSLSFDWPNFWFVRAFTEFLRMRMIIVLNFSHFPSINLFGNEPSLALVFAVCSATPICFISIDAGFTKSLAFVNQEHSLVDGGKLWANGETAGFQTNQIKIETKIMSKSSNKIQIFCDNQQTKR